MTAVSAGDLVGSWTLVSYRTSDLDGTGEDFPMGSDARGLLVYSADGYMSVQIGTPHRPPFRDGELHGGRETERASAAAGYLAYAGRYQVRSDAVVIHLPDVSLFPNWEARPILRKATLQGTELRLGLVEPIVTDGRPRTGQLTWQRVQSLALDPGCSAE